jgi:hypothetical protein
MTITVDWNNRIVDSTSSITDVIDFHNTLRQLEASATGVIYPPIIKYQEGDLGGGAKFPIVSFVNSYRLRFPSAGNYSISGGNVNAQIVPVAGVFVDRLSSAAYAVTSVGGGEGGGITFTPEDVANSVWGHSFVSKLLTVAKYIGLK